MQIRIHLQGDPEPLRVPVHYNALLQGILYNYLELHLAHFLHQEGWQDGKRRLRLFAFSRLLGKRRREGNTWVFEGPVTWYVASPWEPMLSSLAVHLVRERHVPIGEAMARVTGLEVLTPPPYQRPVRLKALSPITVYSTLTTPDGRKKTYYYAPQEPEFGQQVLANLQRKIRAWTGEDVPLDGATLRPVRVSNRNLVVARYKGTIIKGWTGIYELDAPEPYFRMALDAGLGAKNSQGFGFVTVWQPRGKARAGGGRAGTS